MAMRVALAGVLGLVFVSVAECPAATAQSYPSRQVNLVVPFPAGSETDGLARPLADRWAGRRTPSPCPQARCG